ncbi:MAG: uroporphyrinogen-III synthase [Rhizobiaceae bacterium]|nr:uroporphyrinogen-III synthase [Rhizobiaceae bacterium]
MQRVLVTRPEPGASATATRLREMGMEPIVLPLTHIVALPVPEHFPVCDAVAVTSANAVRNAPESLIRTFADKPCFAVGTRTATAAKAAGFSDIRVGIGDAHALADLMICECPGPVTYLAGRVRLPDFEDALRRAGLVVETVETYDAVPVELSSTEIEHLRSGRRIDAVLLYSATAADALLRLEALPALSETFSSCVHCCLSDRIAGRFNGTARHETRIAERPEEYALLKLLTG